MALFYLVLLLIPSLISATLPHGEGPVNVKGRINCHSTPNYEPPGTFAADCWEFIGKINEAKDRELQKVFGQLTVETPRSVETGLAFISLDFKSCQIIMFRRMLESDLISAYVSTTWADPWGVLADCIKGMMIKCVEKNTDALGAFNIHTSTTPEPLRVMITIRNLRSKSYEDYVAE